MNRQSMIADSRCYPTDYHDSNFSMQSSDMLAALRTRLLFGEKRRSDRSSRCSGLSCFHKQISWASAPCYASDGVIDTFLASTSLGVVTLRPAIRFLLCLLADASGLLPSLSSLGAQASSALS